MKSLPNINLKIKSLKLEDTTVKGILKNENVMIKNFFWRELTLLKNLDFKTVKIQKAEIQNI